MASKISKPFGKQTKSLGFECVDVRKLVILAFTCPVWSHTLNTGHLNVQYLNVKIVNALTCLLKQTIQSPGSTLWILSKAESMMTCKKVKNGLERGRQIDVTSFF